MDGARIALIVATDEYDDERLARLRSPGADAEALAEVLADPAIGGFEVSTVRNRPWHEIARSVAELFRDRRPDDLLLLHFSCHGLKDDSGELYFAATDTSLDLLEATAVSSSTVNRAMDRSRAGRVLLLLDCCYAGAFARGMVARAGGDVDVNERLGGRGRAVITASSAMQFAFEAGAPADGAEDVQPSLFTTVLVDGLRSGDADRDLDGWISLDELYAYVHDAVTDANPDQTPRKWAFDIEGDLRVARRGVPVSTPSELPEELRRSMASPLTWERVAVVEPLSDLLHAGHPGRALAARQALEEMVAHDDSDRVRTTARTALDVEPETTVRPAPTPPEVPAPRRERPVRSRGTRRWRARPRLVAMLAAAAVLVVGGSVVAYGLLSDDGAGGDDGSDGASAGALSDSEIVATQVNDGPSQVVAIGSDGNTRPLVDEPDASLPTLNQQRDRLVVLKNGADRGRQPWVVDDLTAATPTQAKLFAPAAEDSCPRANRPAWDSSGGRLAIVCTDLDGSNPALWILDLHDDGNLPDHPLLERDSLAGSPTWGGDGNIYFAETGDDDTTTDLYFVQADDPVEPTEIATGGKPAWLSHVDWCEKGLLYLRSPEEDGPGTIELYANDRAYHLVTESPVTSPTWGPGCSGVAWLAPSSNDASRDTLWTAPFLTDRGVPKLGTPTESGVQGDIGAPAWGDR